MPFNGTTWLVNLTFQIVMAPPEGGTLLSNLSLEAVSGCDFCLLNTSGLEIPHEFLHGVYRYVDFRHMRGDTQSVNGLTAYKLGANQSDTARVAALTVYENSVVYWGIRVWKRSLVGVETEITFGTPVAQVSRSLNGQGLQNATWNCPNIALNVTDSIVIRTYCKASGSWVLQTTFTTAQLNAQSLNEAVWTVFYWTKRQLDWIGSGYRTIGYFRWGTSTYDSRIQDFTVTRG